MMNALHHLLQLNEDRDKIFLSEISSLLKRCDISTHDGHVGSDMSMIDLSSVLFARLLVILFAEVEGCTNNTVGEYQKRSCQASNLEGKGESTKKETDSVDSSKSESSNNQTKPKLPVNGQNEDTKVSSPSRENPPKKLPGGKKSISTHTSSVDSTVSSFSTRNPDSTDCTDPTTRIICTGIAYLFTEEHHNHQENNFDKKFQSKETLAKIATTFSTFLNSTSNNGPSSKKEDSLEALPKVADIVAFCIRYIENCSDDSVFFWCGLCRALIRYRSENKIDDSKITIPQIVQDQLRYIILNSLKFLRDEIKSCCEDYHDFMYLWDCFATKGSILSPLIQPTKIVQSTSLDGTIETKSTEDEPSIKRSLNLVWLLYLTVSLHMGPRKNTDSNNANEKHRSNRILTIASCISLVAFCSSKSKDRKRQFGSPNDSLECSNSKRVKRDDREDQNSSTAYYTNQIHEDEQAVSKMNKSTQQHSIVLNPVRPSLEDDAIAALSMMVAAGSGASSGDESPSFSKQQNTSYQEILEMLLLSCNQLISTLFSTDHNVPISALSLESEIKMATACIMKHYGSKLSPNNEIFQKDVNALMKTEQCNEPMRNQNKASSISPVSSQHYDACKKLDNETMSVLSSFISSDDDVRANIKVLSSLYNNVIKYPTRSDCQGFTKLMNFHFLDKHEVFENESIRAKLIMFVKQKELYKDVHTSQFIIYESFSDYVSTVSSKAQAIKQPKLSATLPHSGFRNASCPNDFKQNTDLKNMSNKSTKSVNHRFPPVRKITEFMEINEWTEVILNSFVSSKSIKPSLRLKSYLESAHDNHIETNSQSKFNLTENARSLKWQDIMIPILNRTLNRILDYTSRPLFPITNHSSNEFSLFDQSSNTAFSVNENFHIKHDGEFDLSKCESVFLISDPQFKITPEVFGAAMISLYYISLESILTYETARLKTSSHRKLINSVSFHRALLSVCYVCLAKATGGVTKGVHDVDHIELFPSIPLAVHSILQKMECSSYEYLKVSEAFVRAFVVNCHSMQYNGDRNEFSLGLPSRLVRYIRDIDEIFLDSLLWDSLRNECNEDIRMYTMIKVIEKLKSAGERGADCKWPPGILHPSLPEEMLDDFRNDQGKSSNSDQILATDLYPEYLYITYLLRKFLGVTSRRISTLCASLAIPPKYPVATQIWIAFRFLLRNNIELLYDRHVDQLILCTIYSVCKMMKISPDISFAMIIEKYTSMNKERLGETICQRITRHVKLDSIENEDSAMDFHSDNLTPQTKNEKYGNIISFYNQVYVPAMKQHLLRSKSLKKATSDLKRMLAEHNANEMIKNIHDATKFADNGRLPTNIVRQDSSLDQNVLTSEPKCHINSVPPTRVGNNNFFVKIIPQETNATSQTNMQVGRINESTAYNGTRILVNLGTPNMKEISIVNNQINKKTKIQHG